MLRYLAVAAVVAVSSISEAQQRQAPVDRFAPLRPFVGTWRGDQSGKPGKGTAERTYEFILDSRFLQERNTSTYPPQERNPAGEVHHHMSIFSWDGGRGALVFRQFHTEGFVNTYVQQPSDGKTLVFVTQAIENIPAGWRARETYTFLSDDELTERFELAEPGHDFELYSEAHLRRVR